MLLIAECGPDHLLYRLNLLQHLGVPEPQDPEPLSLQPPSPLCIAFSLLRVLSAVHLDDQPLLQTDEVNNVRPQGLLTPKPMPAELLEAQPTPQLAFRFCQVPSERPGGEFDATPPSHPSPARGDGVNAARSRGRSTSASGEPRRAGPPPGNTCDHARGSARAEPSECLVCVRGSMPMSGPLTLALSASPSLA